MEEQKTHGILIKVQVDLSAGSASAATSAGLVAFSIGTETLGSIISPSTRCGVTGLRPTYGTVSTNGFMTLSWSMDKVGPIARSASDAAIVFNVIKYKDSLKQRPLKINSIKNLKIGYLKNLFEKDTSRYAVNNSKIIEIPKVNINWIHLVYLMTIPLKYLI